VLPRHDDAETLLGHESLSGGDPLEEVDWLSAHLSKIETESLTTVSAGTETGQDEHVELEHSIPITNPLID
jgi:hypothetical protein